MLVQRMASALKIFWKPRCLKISTASIYQEALLWHALPSGFDAVLAVPFVPFFGDASINLMNVDQMLKEMEEYYF